MPHRSGNETFEESRIAKMPAGAQCKLFKSEEGYNKFCDYVIQNGPFDCQGARSLYEDNLKLLKTNFGGAKVFAELMKAKFPDSLTFTAGPSIYNGESKSQLKKE